jgi:hypothetical protein
MPEYADFYTDPENSALFFKTSKGDFVKCDSHLQPLSSFEGIKYTYKATCRNGSLYILGGNKMWDDNKLWQINTNDKIIVSPIYTNMATEEIEPNVFERTVNGTFGSIGNRIYITKGYNGKWNYACTLPFATDSGALSLKDTGTILFSRNDDSLFYYGMANAQVERRARKGMLEHFCSKDIQSILFSKGSSGCFDQSSDTMVYELKGERFVLSRKIYTGGATVDLRDNADEINKRVVEEFVKKIPAIYKKQAGVGELEFTQQEYDTCKQNIQAFKTVLERQIK